MGWITLGAVAWAADGVSWVWVDRAAREAGLRVTLDDVEVDATLPIEVDPGVELAIEREDDDPRRTWLDEGFVYLVTGARGQVRLVAPGKGVDPDRVRVFADEATVDTLCVDVGCTWRTEGDGFLLEQADLLVALSQAAIPSGPIDFEVVPYAPTVRRVSARVTTRVDRDRDGDGLVSARAAGLLGAEPRARTPRKVRREPRTRWLLPERVAVVVTAGGPRPPELVGWYCAEDGCLVLGVDGAARQCVITEVGDEVRAYTVSSRALSGLSVSCAALGSWHSVDGGVQAGPAVWVWSDGALVRRSQ